MWKELCISSIGMNINFRRWRLKISKQRFLISTVNWIIKKIFMRRESINWSLIWRYMVLSLISSLTLEWSMYIISDSHNRVAKIVSEQDMTLVKQLQEQITSLNKDKYSISSFDDYLALSIRRESMTFNPSSITIRNSTMRKPCPRQLPSHPNTESCWSLITN